MTTLEHLAKVVRSKNSGPFELTFDIMFGDVETYGRVKRSGVLTPELLCSVLRIPQADIVVSMFFDPALAYKFTVKRPGHQGSVGERDTFGAQQHAPLLSIEIPESRGAE